MDTVTSKQRQPYVQDSGYKGRTHELTVQEAGLQLVRWMRGQIDHSRFCRHSGNPTTDILSVGLDWEPGLMPAHALALLGLSLQEKAKLVREILTPYVLGGDIPEFDLVVVHREYAADYLRIDFPYPL
jgi:hypothetical protein